MDEPPAIAPRSNDGRGRRRVVLTVVPVVLVGLAALIGFVLRDSGDDTAADVATPSPCPAAASGASPASDQAGSDETDTSAQGIDSVCVEPSSVTGDEAIEVSARCSERGLASVSIAVREEVMVEVPVPADAWTTEPLGYDVSVAMAGLIPPGEAEVIARCGDRGSEFGWRSAVFDVEEFEVGAAWRDGAPMRWSVDGRPSTEAGSFVVSAAEPVTITARCPSEQVTEERQVWLWKIDRLDIDVRSVLASGRPPDVVVLPAGDQAEESLEFDAVVDGSGLRPGNALVAPVCLVRDSGVVTGFASDRSLPAVAFVE